MTLKKGVFLFLEKDCGVCFYNSFVFQKIFINAPKFFKSVCFTVLPAVLLFLVLANLYIRKKKKTVKAKSFFITDCQRLLTNLYHIHFMPGSFVNNRTHSALRINYPSCFANGTYLKDTCIIDIAIVFFTWKFRQQSYP